MQLGDEQGDVSAMLMGRVRGPPTDLCTHASVPEHLQDFANGIGFNCNCVQSTLWVAGLLLYMGDGGVYLVQVHKHGGWGFICKHPSGYGCTESSASAAVRSMHVIVRQQLRVPLLLLLGC